MSGLLLAGLLYWLLVTTEGVFLGWRIVVWLYDMTAHKYDGLKEFNDEAERFFVIRPLRRHLRHIPNPIILDVATGTGRLPSYLLGEATFNGRVVGLDPARKMLHLAVPKLAPYRHRTMLVRGTAVPLPFPSNHFDAVACLESLEFFPSDIAALGEMARVLKPGGVLMITRRRGKDAKYFLNRYRTREQFESLLIELGLIEVNTQPWQFDYDQVFGKKPFIAGK
ncbi:MAG: methyltransferase domain-containing protein [Chloroflexi bacterium]|nr:methyltransferase domain-containing protein [Chloroflexota bacterium]